MIKKHKIEPDLEVVLYIEKPRATMTRTYDGDYRVLIQELRKRPHPMNGKPMIMRTTMAEFICRNEQEARDLFATYF
jgi:hypothetical protein